MKKGLIVTLVIGAAATGFILYLKRPKAEININDTTGDGTAKLGNKTGTFNKTTGVMLSTWNGYQLSVGNGYRLSKNGKNLVTSQSITPYDGGDSYVTINHTK